MQSVRILDEKTIMSFALRSPNASFRSVPLTWRQNRTVFVTSGTFRFDRGSKRWPDVNLSRSLLPLRAVKSSKEPTIASVSRIQVKHQTHISLSREQIWNLCKEMCGEREWLDIYSVLAGIECIHRFECVLEGESVLQAFQKANELKHVVGNLEFEDLIGTGNEIDASADGNKLSEKKHFLGMLYGFIPFVNKSKEPLADLEKELEKREQNAEYHKINQQAKEADQKFVLGIKALLHKAHYERLDVRDVALSRSLNSDYLAQIFIKADTSKMDETFLENEMSDDLPAEVRPMLTFKRGYGVKSEYRRLFLPMMDYLQLLVVKSAFNTFKDGLIYLWDFLVDVLKRILKALGLHQESEETTDGKVPSKYDAEGLMNQHHQIDRKSWKKIKRVGKDVLVSMNEWGISPRVKSLQRGLWSILYQVMAMGGGTLVTLADWGYIPRLDALPIDNFDSVWPIREGRPVYLRRIALPNTMSYVLKDGPSGLFKKVELQEPTFEHLVVIYRYQDKESPFSQLKQKIRGPNPPRIEDRKEIQIRIYNQIPIPIWKAVIPAKLLQFRPLDGLRLDLITLIGLVSLAATARFTSVLFDIVTLATVTVYGIRVIMGYKKMYDRYESFLNDLLRRRTIAGQEGALAYLANSAYLQQFKQSALAYTLLVSHGTAMRKEEIVDRINETLRALEEKITFDVDDALKQLRRMKLVRLSFVAGYGESYFATTPSRARHLLKDHWLRLLQEESQYHASTNGIDLHPYTL